MKTLVDVFEKIAADSRPDLLRVRTLDHFRPVAASDFVADVGRCARALAQLGIGRGDRVALVAHNRPEWHVIDFGVHLVGAILVPLFGNLTPARVRFILRNSGASLLFVEGPKQRAKLERIHDQVPHLRHVVFLPRLAVDRQGKAPGDPGPGMVGYGEFLAGAGDGDVGEFPGPADEQALATLIYTSGTTGEPKGVALTHRNLISNVEALLQVIPASPNDLGLSVLPLCHVFQRTVDYTYLAAGAAIAYGSPDRLADEFLMARPTCMVGVPRLYERFRSVVLQEVAQRGVVARRLFAWAEDLGQRNARAQLAGGSFGLLERLQHFVADRLVLRRVRAGTGGRVAYLVSGGAALDPELNWWFEAMGIRLIQGYGLTESSPVIAVNPVEANRIGTVGPPLPGVEVRIAEDGEILTRGPHVMRGYWNDPEATAEAVEDGWLHTGDVGGLDDDGYLRVTDRKKHLIVTSTGKNVAPQPIENALKQSPYIEHVLVVGDDRKFVSGLVVPDFDMLETWAGEQGLGIDDRAALVAHPRVRELFEDELERLQEDLAPYERVREFRLLEAPFSVDEGTLTPTLKTVRREVESRYADLIEEIYRE